MPIYLDAPVADEPQSVERPAVLPQGPRQPAAPQTRVSYGEAHPCDRVCEICGLAFRVRWRALPGRFCSNSCKFASRRMSSEALFWSHLPADRSADDCWIWTGPKRTGGYGTLHGITAHRFSYALAHGPIPADLCVLHRCDVPACCNPAHLFLGTVEDNNADRHQKGRSAGPRGESNRGARLTPIQVLEIRAAVGTHKDIADRYGVSTQLVSAIRCRKVWSWL